MTLLCDIGGTYIRIAVAKDGTPDDIRKYEVAGFPDLQSALARYCEDAEITPDGSLMIATAGYEDQGVWKFVNQNTWEIDPPTIEKAGWQIEKILNDFEAATWSLLDLQCGDVQTLKGGDGASDTRCLIGPGTGLGLAYLHMGDAPFVQKTHGGHMVAASLTDEQHAAISAFDAPVVFEDLVSGPGLQKLRGLYGEEKALRLFHEFFGLFAANVVVTGHAYGGLYLTGGVLENLMKDNKFDTDRFEKYFHLSVVDSVQRDLKATPIVYLQDPYPALKGLINAP